LFSKGIFGSPDVARLMRHRNTSGLIAALRNGRDGETRRQAAEYLGELGGATAYRPLMDALDDSEEEVRYAAARALDLNEGRESPDADEPGFRPIRVFVSSTFRDMQVERDLLAKEVFPEVRQRCRELGAEMVAVDLRWGVTEKQADRGEVLAICLHEIEQCRPYFIGILGERYGSVPARIDAELLDEQDWLATAESASTTELEIMHGVLNNPAMMPRSFFYFRDPAYAEGQPPAARPTYQAESPAATERVKALKERILAAGLTVRVDYPDPPALASLVLADLMQAVEMEHPAGAADPLARERIGHEAFAATRTQAYVAPDGAYGRLDQHALGDGPPLLVLGASGAGKSALLANWTRRYHRSHPDDLLLLHFIGSTPHSTDYVSLLRRVMEELKRHVTIDEPVPETPEAVIAAFARWLDLAAVRRRVILVVDGLDQLAGRDAAAELGWLPERFPSGVRVVLSTLPGRSLDVLQARGWPAFTIEGLDWLDRKRLIYNYLATYKKRLSNAQVDRLASAPVAGVPLYLRAILEELRVSGSHELLDQTIAHYVAAPDLDDLYQRILQRLERDFEQERPRLVGDALALIWAARGGLAESELLDLLTEDDRPLPRMEWSPLYLALQEALVSRAGQMTFFHSYLRRAVEARYLAGHAERQVAHRRLAAYFQSHSSNPRRFDELPWQYQEAGDWGPLYDLLSDVDFFAGLWQHDEFATRRYWARLTSQAGLRPEDAYRPVIDRPDDYEPHLVDLSVLLADAGDTKDALALREHLVDNYRRSGQRAKLAAALNNQATILHQRGDYSRARALIEEALTLYRDHVGNEHDEIAALNTQAILMRDEGRYGEALTVLGELERLCRGEGEDEWTRQVRDPGEKVLMALLGNQAVVLEALGRWDEALERQRERERIAARHIDHQQLAQSLGGQASLLTYRGQLAEASELRRQEAEIYRDLGDQGGLQSSLNNQGQILLTMGDHEGALSLASQQAEICRRIQDPEGLTAALLLTGVLQMRKGEHADALQTLTDAEELARARGDKVALHSALGNQAIIHRLQGHLDLALALQVQVQALCEELGDRRGLQTSLGNQGNILMDQGDVQGALRLYERKSAICEELDYPSGKALALANQAVLYVQLKDVPNAVRCAQSAQELIARHGLNDLAGQVGQTLESIASLTR